MVTQLLFFTSRVRKYIKISIDFLCNRVISVDYDNWVNLVRGLRYIRGTLHLPLILRAYSLIIIKW